MSSLIRSLPEESWQTLWHQCGSNVITGSLLSVFPKAVFAGAEEPASHHTTSTHHIRAMIATKGALTIKRELIWH